MNLDERVELWNTLQEFEPGEPSKGTPLISRVMEYYEWSEDYARRTIEEYRRFVYLSCVADFDLVPSQAVDEVWHVHLTYTRSYWDDMCGKIIKRQLHHEPKNAPVGVPKFDNAYVHTLDLYVEHIGHEPPADIWGSRDALKQRAT